MVASILDAVRFLATSNGTADFVPASTVTGYQSMSSAGAVDATTYYYRAESVDLTEWEIGLGTWTSGTTTLARTTVLFSSNSGSKTSFTSAPNVGIVALAENLVTTRLSSKTITFTRDLSTASGNVGYTGIGFQPTTCSFHGIFTDTSSYAYTMQSFVDSAKNGYATLQGGLSAGTASGNYAILMGGTNTGIAPTSTGQTATVNSYDADGFTLAYTKHGSPTGTATFYAICKK